jgi:hypothetical protein
LIFFSPKSSLRKNSRRSFSSAKRLLSRLLPVLLEILFAVGVAFLPLPDEMLLPGIAWCEWIHKQLVLPMPKSLTMEPAKKWEKRKVPKTRSKVPKITPTENFSRQQSANAFFFLLYYSFPLARHVAVAPRAFDDGALSALLLPRPTASVVEVVDFGYAKYVDEREEEEPFLVPVSRGEP